MQIKVFEILKPEITEKSISPRQIGSELSDEVVVALRSTPLFQFPVNMTEINDRAQVHCEKWVEEVGLHLVNYAAAIQAPDLNYPSTQSLNRRILKNKVYSGDVSGTIGEALFSLFLTKYLLVSENDFAHLKSNKTSGVYPDFAIYIPSQEMLSHFAWVTPFMFDEIPAEVKNANAPTKASVRPQLVKAIQQIRNFWNHRNLACGPSIIGLTVRNQNTQTYDLVIIWR